MATPFLRIPPFPRHRARPLATLTRSDEHGPGDHAEVSGLAEGLRAARVGGSFWGPAFPPAADPSVVLCAAHPGTVDSLIAAARDAGVLQGASLRCSAAMRTLPPGLSMLPRQTDPWSIADRASLIVADADDEAALVAALLGKPLQVVGRGRFAALAQPGGLDQVLADEVARATYRDPFNGRSIDAPAAIELLARWRDLIMANRPVAEIHGVARWKRVTADAMLWDGTGPVRYGPQDADPGRPLALAWFARSDPAAIGEARARALQVGEIEDGMIRSIGLGANCVPPLSIVVDRQGPHFDPALATDFETLLQTAEIGPDMRARAAALRQSLVAAGIGKYGSDGTAGTNGSPRGERRVVLVTGQVEDDRSVLLGAPGMSNLDLLRRARDLEPDAQIIFKPHPDVEAGHRKGHVPDADAMAYADAIDRSASMAALLARVDAIHVLTSLAGFEALLRGVEVVTHGVPFYAGWGLTRDHGPVPDRRSRRLTLDELVAATLILYPRYLDPLTRLPCEPEVLIARIVAGKAQVRSPLVMLREVQGKVSRLFTRRNIRS